MLRSAKAPFCLIVLALLIAGPTLADKLAAVGPNDAAASAKAKSESPIEVVEGLHGILVETMKLGKKAGFDARLQRVSPAVERAFDVEYMSAKCVGRHWKKLDDAEKAGWRAQFMGLLTANYAGNFKDFDGERFETLGEEPSARSTQIVMTKLIVPGDEDVAFNYRLKERDGQWRIIDIYLRGTVSELALRRSDFASILKRDGFEELTVAVDEKIAKLRKKGS